MRIIVQQIERHQWCAWVEGHIKAGFTGAMASQATLRLLETLPDITADNLAVDDEHTKKGRYVYRVVCSEPCPDCKGSGRYVGLVKTGECATCRGAGRSDAPR